MSTAVLAALLAVLVGSGLRLGPPPRRPASARGGWAGDLEPSDSEPSDGATSDGEGRDGAAAGRRRQHPPDRVVRSGAAGAGTRFGRARPAGRGRPTVGRHRRPLSDPADVAAWCDRLSRSVRSGTTLAAAVPTVDPPPAAADTVRHIALTLERGTPLAEALASASGDRHVELALTVLRACALHGGPAAEPLDRTAAILRGRAAELADRRTQSAQARLSAMVMTLLPVAMLMLLLVTSSAVRDAVASPAGTLTIVAGTALNLTGWWWMRRVIDGATG